MFFMRLLATLSLMGLSFPAWGQVPYDPSPFDILGSITDMSLDQGGGPLAGGIITVNGIPIVVPKNLIATLPATAVSWPELFTGNPPVANMPGWPASQSWTAHVQGNRVGDLYIAGLVYISQNAQILQGFITSISADGHFKVAGSFSPAGGIDCVINDPLGIYAPKYSNNPLWSVDPQNPSIKAQTGFPMCIPDASRPTLCPATNRIDPGTGKPFMIFTMKSTTDTTRKAADPDPLTMVPLIVGDFVTFSGQQVGTVYEINALEANVGIFTAPGSKPSYITVENVNIGITSPALAAVANLAVGETKSVAWTTDPTTLVEWFTQDVDWCTGNITENLITSIQPSTAAPLGRSTMRLGKIAISTMPKNVVFRLATGTVATNTENKFLAGVYVQPVMAFIFPELTVAGANFPANSFDVMTFLAQGSGPYIPGNAVTPPLANPPIIGQLNPWPGKPTPAIQACPTVAPVVSPSPVSTPPPKETLVITEATQLKARQGFVQVIIKASDNLPSANLFATINGPNNLLQPLTKAPLTNNGDGTWGLTANNKAAGTSLTVFSDIGATQTVPLAPI